MSRYHKPMSRQSIFFSIRCFTLVCIPFLTSCGDAVSPSQAGQAQQPNKADKPKINTALPGADAPNDELDEQLQQAWARREPGYKPRTQHLQPDGTPKYTNRLFFESSPYLLQHAHNPMNWHAWGDEAFEKARALGRPVLLSVGYSTCHWCHVMEEESFDDEEIARYINENYVPIKVDREIRPDIDAIYMSAVQAMRGRGGWPMTVWLTPDREPFYAGTYFPARDGDRGTSMGFLTLVAKLKEIYDNEPDRVTKQTKDITSAINRAMEPQTGSELPGPEVLHQLASFYKGRFDDVNGGARGSPKFPSSLPIRGLLRYHRRTADKRSLEMAELTLDKMARGGMYDQAGGGFHRYSTDEDWLVPHFEKMLYDNALLVTAYLEGYQVTGREDFAAVARDILRYVERDMTSPEGAFYSATDADSLNPEGHREEGWFFTWTPAEIAEVLGEERTKTVVAYYGVSEAGNFEGRNILHRPKPAVEVAAKLGMPAEKLRSIVEETREELYAARAKRPPPLRDDKVLTAWNGLMISAHAQAALILGDADYAKRAERAAAFLLKNLRRDQRLLRSYRSGRAGHNAYLDDYAFLIAALLDLYEATGNPDWLRDAIDLEGVLEDRYQDGENGGFFMTSDDHEELLAREKPSYDGAEPSGNSVAVMNLVRLHEFTTEDRFRETAARALRAFDPILKRSPAALSEMLLALDFQLDTPKEVIIVTPESRGQAEPFLLQLRRTFLPNRVLSVVPEPELSAHAKLLPLVEGKRAIKGRPTAYVCEKRVCELPTSDPETFAQQIGWVKPLEQSVSE